MNGPIPLEEAWERLLAMIEPLESEAVPTADANRRVLAAPLMAQRTQPYADLSAMDGFACSGAGPWRLIGESRAGHPFAGHVAAGEATRISTGAPVPQGADRILLVEQSEIEGDTLHSTKTPEVGRHIRRRGFDFDEGDVLLEKGTKIGPRQIGLALSAGCAILSVSRKPHIAILECGDELVADIAACPPDGLPASNGAMLATMVENAGGVAERIGPVADKRDALIAAIEKVCDADLLVTIGGASVGEHDHMKPALKAVGADLAFWRVAIRPGKPLLIARRPGQLVIGLPGNPASSFVAGFLFALPAIRAMMGDERPLPRSLPVPAAMRLPEGGRRREFIRGLLTDGKAVALDERDSSALRTLAVADILIDRPAGADEVETGTPVPCYHLQNG